MLELDLHGQGGEYDGRQPQGGGPGRAPGAQPQRLQPPGQEQAAEDEAREQADGGALQTVGARVRRHRTEQ